MGAVPLLDSVWLVGSGSHPDALTDPHDCHCYLIWDGSGGVLVDTGTGLGARAWLAAVAEVCDPAALSGAIVTHYHADHAGGAAATRAAGLPVLASAETAAALATADESRTSLAAARAVGVYPSDYRLAPSTVDRVLAGGDIVRAGELDVEILDAPGHCDGHLVVLLRHAGRTILFSGDCLFAGGRVSLQAIHDCRLDRYAETVNALAGREVDVLLPGHGEPVLRDALVDIGRAAESFRRLVPPPNVLTS
ncbi:MBL fold metallo-hydrolase [Plantactinospora sp. KLBMP9567]|uniref:MBL fold metallo-hydrolase n=1 Tax=Plantactinospora sp. KLBMP9567 TaxID=3085900 RepID=UPI0029828291|nr:MBL fold metallo-hydrolase [Plantactinospora sp. KLBMP9567]MDW5325016.1 MBL fold metallo-hydrolase [Plantactinospora sp. KLBMP9567]